MSTSSNDPDQLRVKGTVMSDKAYGTLLCILSDTLFSVVYIFVQFINRGWFLQGETFSPDWRGDWILCFKEWIAAMFAIPIFIYLWRTGKTSIPGIKVILGLIAAAFFCEYIGIGHHVLANDLIGMALGLPVLGTPVGGLQNILSGNCGGICADAEAFVSRAEQLLTDPAAYEAASAAARVRAEDYADKTAYYDTIERAARAAIGRE